MGNFAQEERINLAFKHALNIMGTMNLDGSLGRSWYEELYTNSHIVINDDIWTDTVPIADDQTTADNNVITNPTILESYRDPNSFPNTTHGRLRLTIEPATNDSVLFARSIPGDPTSSILKDWLQPQKFGQGYTVRLFDSATGGNEITTTQGQGWFFYWQQGCLILGNGTTPQTAFGVTDIYIEGYRYIGSKGVTSSTQLSADRPELISKTTPTKQYYHIDISTDTVNTGTFRNNKTGGGNETTTGVVTDPPNNTSWIYDADMSPITTNITADEDDIVYGRITISDGQYSQAYFYFSDNPSDTDTIQYDNQTITFTSSGSNDGPTLQVHIESTLEATLQNLVDVCNGVYGAPPTAISNADWKTVSNYVFVDYKTVGVAGNVSLDDSGCSVCTASDSTAVDGQDTGTTYWRLSLYVNDNGTEIPYPVNVSSSSFYYDYLEVLTSPPVIPGIYKRIVDIGPATSTNTIGTPSDGTFDDGALQCITPSTTIADGFDCINEALNCLIPDNCEGINGVILGDSLTKYNARESQSNINYEFGPGTANSYTLMTPTSNFTLTLPDPATRFNYADQGTLELYINGTLVDSFDLAAAFDEAYRGDCQGNGGVQGSTYNGGQGIPAYGSNYGTGSYITITDVRMYNGWPYWQKGNAEFTIVPSDLRQGYNYIYVVHNIPNVGIQQTADWKIFNDTDTGADPSVSNVDITIDTSTLRHLSGVPYYDIGSTFNLDVIGHDCFDNVYIVSNDPIRYYNFPGVSNGTILYTDSSVTGVSNPPDIGETMTVTDFQLTVTQNNQASCDARITCDPQDPYGVYSAVNSPSHNIMVDTYHNPSDDLHEYFNDESYRLTSDYNKDHTPSSASGEANWDSTISLVTGGTGYNDGLQVGIDCNTNQPALFYPTRDYTSSDPSGPNYSGLSGTRYYLRLFQDNISHTNGHIRITGPSRPDIENGVVKVELCVPVNGAHVSDDPTTGTGWLDLSQLYNSATFHGDDGDGCRVAGGSGDEYYFTLGTFSTSYANNCLLVRVSFDETYAGPPITEISITNW